MTPFIWMGFNCFEAADLLPGDSLLFTTRSKLEGRKADHHITLPCQKHYGCIDRFYTD